MSLPSQTKSVTGAPIISQAIAWHKAGHGVALATVSQTWGSSPCPVGSHLAVRDDAAFEGSVSGGCIEGEVVAEALGLIRAGEGCKSLDFGIAHEDAWHVGLACGGKVSVFVSALDDNTASVMKGLETAISTGKATALLADQNTGAHGLWVDGALEAGDHELNGAQIQELAARFASDRSGTIGGESEHPLFARVYNPRLRMFIVGAVHIAQNLAEMAARAGYDITVIDPRDTWSTDERFPSVKLDRRWPSIALEDLRPDIRTAVVFPRINITITVVIKPNTETIGNSETRNDGFRSFFIETSKSTSCIFPINDCCCNDIRVTWVTATKRHCFTKHVHNMTVLR